MSERQEAAAEFFTDAWLTYLGFSKEEIQEYRSQILETLKDRGGGA